MFARDSVNVEIGTGEDTIIAKIARKWIDTGLPSCPTDGTTFVCDAPEGETEDEEEEG